MCQSTQKEKQRIRVNSTLIGFDSELNLNNTTFTQNVSGLASALGTWCLSRLPSFKLLRAFAAKKKRFNCPNPAELKGAARPRLTWVRSLS